MAEIIIYSTKVCPYCVQAKALLQRKGLTETDWKEIDATDPEVRADMMEKSAGQRTVPQIFIGSQHVGGFDDLRALDQSGKLEEMLAS